MGACLARGSSFSFFPMRIWWAQDPVRSTGPRGLYLDRPKRLGLFLGRMAGYSEPISLGSSVLRTCAAAPRRSPHTREGLILTLSQSSPSQPRPARACSARSQQIGGRRGLVVARLLPHSPRGAPRTRSGICRGKSSDPDGCYSVYLSSLSCGAPFVPPTAERRRPRRSGSGEGCAGVRRSSELGLALDPAAAGATPPTTSWPGPSLALPLTLGASLPPAPGALSLFLLLVFAGPWLVPVVVQRDVVGVGLRSSARAPVTSLGHCGVGSRRALCDLRREGKSGARGRGIGRRRG